ncbi:hypothetical protein NDU88_003868 [Pleurodeles waltl]|uniref:Uncharacterized protein n=1 Tax=Pleurodeles waltl TaxID=8319 RepID=A0AAV7NJH4_PLEWA|nr:hypothetical protein NDU88_003868 [Pleurodeles waltl]
MVREEVLHAILACSPLRRVSSKEPEVSVRCRGGAVAKGAWAGKGNPCPPRAESDGDCPEGGPTSQRERLGVRHLVEPRKVGVGRGTYLGEGRQAKVEGLGPSSNTITGREGGEGRARPGTPPLLGVRAPETGKPRGQRFKSSSGKGKSDSAAQAAGPVLIQEVQVGPAPSADGLDSRWRDGDCNTIIYG